MNIKKALKQKIGFYEKQTFPGVFYKMLYELINNKCFKEKKLFSHQNEKSIKCSKWEKIAAAIEEIDEKYRIPKLVYNYLMIKAKETYHQIVKFCHKEKFNVRDIVKIYIECSKKINSQKESFKSLPIEDFTSRAPSYKQSTKNMPSLSRGFSLVKKKSLLPSSLIVNEEKKDASVDEEDEEVKKKNAMRKYTNIFIGNVDFNAINKKNKEIKIFEGQYCKTFLLVDKVNPRQSKKLEVKSFSPSKDKGSQNNSRPFQLANKGRNIKSASADIKENYDSLDNHDKSIKSKTYMFKRELKSNKNSISPIKIPLLKKNSSALNMDSNRFSNIDSTSRFINSSTLNRQEHSPILNMKSLKIKLPVLTARTKIPSTMDKMTSAIELECKYGWNMKTLRVKNCN